MPSLQAIHGRVVDLRDHTNVHLYGRRPLGPTDRYELWIKPPDGAERKFTVNTRHMPARRPSIDPMAAWNGCKWASKWRTMPHDDPVGHHSDHP